MSELDAALQSGPPVRGDKVQFALSLMGEEYTEKFHEAMRLDFSNARLAQILTADSNYKVNGYQIQHYKTKWARGQL